MGGWGGYEGVGEGAVEGVGWMGCRGWRLLGFGSSRVRREVVAAGRALGTRIRFCLSSLFAVFGLYSKIMPFKAVH